MQSQPEEAYGAIADKYHRGGLFICRDRFWVCLRTQVKSCPLLLPSNHISKAPMPHQWIQLSCKSRLHDGGQSCGSSFLFRVAESKRGSMPRIQSNCACPNDASSTTYVKTGKMAQDEGWGIHKDSTTRFATESIKSDFRFQLAITSMARTLRDNLREMETTSYVRITTALKKKRMNTEVCAPPCAEISATVRPCSFALSLNLTWST